MGPGAGAWSPGPGAGPAQRASPERGLVHCISPPPGLVQGAWGPGQSPEGPGARLGAHPLNFEKSRCFIPSESGVNASKNPNTAGRARNGMLGSDFKFGGCVSHVFFLV